MTGDSYSVAFIAFGSFTMNCKILFGYLVCFVSILSVNVFSGVFLFGLMIIEYFVVSVVLVFFVIIVKGKFYGVIVVVMSIGCFIIMIFVFVDDEGMILLYMCFFFFVNYFKNDVVYVIFFWDFIKGLFCFVVMIFVKFSVFVLMSLNYCLIIFFCVCVLNFVVYIFCVFLFCFKMLEIVVCGVESIVASVAFVVGFFILNVLFVCDVFCDVFVVFVFVK